MKAKISKRGLEMIMRDVLEGMEELSLQLGYHMDLNGEIGQLQPAPISSQPRHNNIHYLHSKQRKSA